MIGKYAVDGKWYRGEVMNIGPDFCDLYYIDFGNTEKVATENIRHCMEYMKELPQQAVKCKLYNVAQTSSSELPGDILSATVEMILKSREEDCISVDLIHSSGQSMCSLFGGVPKVMVKDMMAVELQGKELTLASVSHVDNFASFCIQLLDQGLSTIIQELAKVVETVPYTPDVGELVCAQFSQDQSWYRSCVLEKLEVGSSKVLFVDYGNLEIVPANLIQKLDPCLTEIPLQAIHCSLFGVSDVDDIEAIQKFQADICSVAVNVRSLSVVDATHSVEILLPNGTLLNKKYEKVQSPAAKATGSPLVTPTKPVVMARSIPSVADDITIGGEIIVTIMDIKAVDDFRVQIIDDKMSVQFKKFMLKLNEAYQSPEHTPYR